MTEYKIATAAELSTLIKDGDLEGTAKLLGFKPENIPDKVELLEKVNEALRSYSLDGHILKF